MYTLKHLKILFLRLYPLAKNKYNISITKQETRRDSAPFNVIPVNTPSPPQKFTFCFRINVKLPSPHWIPLFTKWPNQTYGRCCLMVSIEAKIILRHFQPSSPLLILVLLVPVHLHSTGLRSVPRTCRSDCSPHWLMTHLTCIQTLLVTLEEKVSWTESDSSTVNASLSTLGIQLLTKTTNRPASSPSGS